MSRYELEVINWEKYNPKESNKSHSWLRLDNGVVMDEFFQTMSGSELKVWVWILCERSRKGTTLITLDTEIVQRLIRVRTQFIHTSVTLLTEFGIVRTNTPLGDKGLEEKSGRIRALRTNDTNVLDPIKGHSTSRTRMIQELPPLKKLEMLATRGATRSVAAIHKFGVDDTLAAETDLGPNIWRILQERFPNRTWGNFCDSYRQALDRGAEAFFLRDLRMHFEACIPALMEERQ